MQYSADSRVPRGGKRLVSLARVDYEFVTLRAYYYFLNRRVALYKFYIHTSASLLINIKIIGPYFYSPQK
jgi:hypothetical protein